MDVEHQLQGLRIRRKAAGVSAVEMAKRLGVHRVTYTQYENGKTPIYWNKVLTICNYLGIDNPRRLTEFELTIEEAEALKAHSAQFAVPAQDATLAAAQTEWDKAYASWAESGLPEERILDQVGPRPGSALEPSNSVSSERAGTVVQQHAGTGTLDDGERIDDLLEGWN